MPAEAERSGYMSRREIPSCEASTSQYKLFTATPHNCYLFLSGVEQSKKKSPTFKILQITEYTMVKTRKEMDYNIQIIINRYFMRMMHTDIWLKAVTL